MGRLWRPCKIASVPALDNIVLILKLGDEDQEDRGLAHLRLALHIEIVGSVECAYSPPG
jgi:hypothetical protein